MSVSRGQLSWAAVEALVGVSRGLDSRQPGEHWRAGRRPCYPALVVLRATRTGLAIRPVSRRSRRDLKPLRLRRLGASMKGHLCMLPRLRRLGTSRAQLGEALGGHPRRKRRRGPECAERGTTPCAHSVPLPGSLSAPVPTRLARLQAHGSRRQGHAGRPGAVGGCGAGRGRPRKRGRGGRRGRRGRRVTRKDPHAMTRKGPHAMTRKGPHAMTGKGPHDMTRKALTI